MRSLLILCALASATAAQAQDALPKNPGKEPLAAPPAAAEAPAPASVADPALTALMDRIESAVALPAGSQPVAAHARYYAWADTGRSKVTAVYLAGAPTRAWVGFDDLPDITLMTNGCASVTLVYDVRANRIDEIGCALGA